MKRTEHPFAAAHAAITPNQISEVPTALDSDSELDSDVLAEYPDLAFFKGMPRQQAVVRNPFPSTAVVLDWECLKDLSDLEVSVERIEELFNERRELVRQGIADWRVGFERRLVKMHEAEVGGIAAGAAVEALESDGTEVEPVVTVSL